MTSFEDLSSEAQIETLKSTVSEILEHYNLEAPLFESINHEYNSTFRVTSGGNNFALRVNVNSNRSVENLNAEIFWVNAIESVKVPKPVANRTEDFVTYGQHDASGRRLPAVLYSWLDGAEPGDEPSDDQLFAMGAAMAKLHTEALSISFPESARLSDYSDFFWGESDNLLGPTSQLNATEKKSIQDLVDKVQAVVRLLGESAAKRPIHADLHPWNVMWHEDELAVFDFDDSGIGLPVQDLATSLYYLDTPEQDAAFMAGYQSISPLPQYTDEQMQLLQLQRRVLLLNYLYESTNPEHRAMVEKYKVETFRRLAEANL